MEPTRLKTIPELEPVPVEPPSGSARRRRRSAANSLAGGLVFGGVVAFGVGQAGVLYWTPLEPSA